tara:strand:+ start:80 stop:298 length:219 start_codon:yes stop_codon:yes gene_type:complete
MSNKHEMKLMDNEVNNLSNQVFYLNGLLDKITEWLEQGEDVILEASEDFQLGYHDCAKSLLEQIKEWESEDE